MVVENGWYGTFINEKSCQISQNIRNEFCGLIRAVWSETNTMTFSKIKHPNDEEKKYEISSVQRSRMSFVFKLFAIHLIYV